MNSIRITLEPVIMQIIEPNKPTPTELISQGGVQQPVILMLLNT